MFFSSFLFPLCILHVCLVCQQQKKVSNSIFYFSRKVQFCTFLWILSWQLFGWGRPTNQVELMTRSSFVPSHPSLDSPLSLNVKATFCFGLIEWIRGKGKKKRRIWKANFFQDGCVCYWSYCICMYRFNHSSSCFLCVLLSYISSEDAEFQGIELLLWTCNFYE